VNLGTPVSVTGGTDYVVSYFAPQGRYAGDVGAFATSDRSVGPLFAPRSTTSTPNGVFLESASGGFPTGTFQGTNYWVDVVYTPGTPVAPMISTNPVVEDLTQTSATIKWSTTTASDSMVQYGLTASYGSVSTINTAQVTAHSVALSNLTPGTEYHYRVVSRDAAGGKVMSPDVTFSTTGTAPDTTPPAFVAGSIAATSIDSQTEKITWSTNENSDSLVIFGTTTAYGSNLQPADTDSLTKTHVFKLEFLDPSTQYHYRVLSKDGSGNLATSDDFTFTTSDLKIAAVSAQPPAGEEGQTSATVSWTTDAGADSQVDYGTAVPYSSSTQLDDDEVTTHSVVITGLVANTTYHYRVKSTATPGHTTVSGDFTFKTNAPKITNVVETAVDGRTERITWTTATPMTSQIEYGKTPTFGTTSTLDSNRVTSHSVTLTSLSPGTTYYYRILSRDANDILSSLSDTFTTPADGTPPMFVTGSIKATDITATGVTVVWTTNEASDSQVEYGLTTG
jgi:phosphodiesterase/alkaline phosphatase D-like protein